MGLLHTLPFLIPYLLATHPDSIAVVSAAPAPGPAPNQQHPNKFVSTFHAIQAHAPPAPIPMLQTSDEAPMVRGGFDVNVDSDDGNTNDNNGNRDNDDDDDDDEDDGEDEDDSDDNGDFNDVWDNTSSHDQKFRIISTPKGTVRGGRNTKSYTSRLPCGCVLVKGDLICEHGSVSSRPPHRRQTKTTHLHQQRLKKRTDTDLPYFPLPPPPPPPPPNTPTGDSRALFRRGNHQSHVSKPRDPLPPPPPPPNTPVPDLPKDTTTTTAISGGTGGVAAKLTRRFSSLPRITTSPAALHELELAKRRAPPPVPPNTPVEQPPQPPKVKRDGLEGGGERVLEKRRDPPPVPPNTPVPETEPPKHPRIKREMAEKDGLLMEQMLWKRDVGEENGDGQDYDHVPFDLVRSHDPLTTFTTKDSRLPSHHRPTPKDYPSPENPYTGFHREFGWLYPDAHQGTYKLSVKGLPNIIKNDEGVVVDVAGPDGEPVEGVVEVVEQWTLKSDVGSNRGLVWNRRKGIQG